MASNEGGEPDHDADGASVPEPESAEVRGLLRRLERLIDPQRAVHAVEDNVGAAWRSVTREEPRVQVTVAVLVAIALMVALPARVANRPRGVLPGLAVLLLIGVFVAKSARLERRGR